MSHLVKYESSGHFQNEHWDSDIDFKEIVHNIFQFVCFYIQDFILLEFLYCLLTFLVCLFMLLLLFFLCCLYQCLNKLFILFSSLLHRRRFLISFGVSVFCSIVEVCHLERLLCNPFFIVLNIRFMFPKFVQTEILALLH